MRSASKYIVNEFGHGFAFYTAARKQPLYELHRSSPAVNEIHSKTMEHFMYPYQFCELWADISHKYMPWNKIDIEEVHQGKCWPHQTHIVETPFYYIEYDIAQISTYEFYLKMQRNHKQAWEDYMKLCGAGGSKAYLELLNMANLSNPFSEGTVDNICSPIINEFCSLL